MKIGDKIAGLLKEGRTVFSFEFFPPKTADGVENLFDRLDRMATLDPAFCDITWGAGGSTADLTLDIATKMQNMICVETSMHLTCTNMPVEKINSALAAVKNAGLQNVLALRGDPPKGQDQFVAVEGGFSCALDLVRHIRAQYGDYFGITVAGYPEAHPDVIDSTTGLASREAYRKDLLYLKEKIDAGAELIITQLFYDVDVFLQFVSDCRALGITQPIIPGIMPINNYGGFKRMTTFCKTKVPKEVLAKLEEIKDNEEAVKAYGIHLGVEMCRKILDAGIKTVHLYTLNMEKAAIGILEGLALIDTTKVPRSMPWRKSANVKREQEAVRPVHWGIRPRSYLIRTAEWDRFPSGRWGTASSPAYGTLNDYQFLRRRSRNDKLKEEWCVPLRSTQDIRELFASVCIGEKMTSPWSELEGLQPETDIINQKLRTLNLDGFLTINSQPAVNAAPSDTAHIGWGGKGGYVYQKAYVEFFVAPEALPPLIDRVNSLFPSVTYIAVDTAGQIKTNTDQDNANAVTWGVFPGREIIQPSVVDPRSFLVWKTEAFDAWVEEWAKLYDETQDKESVDILKKIRDTYYLVSLVENDYIKGDIFAVFDK